MATTVVIIGSQQTTTDHVLPSKSWAEVVATLLIATIATMGAPDLLGNHCPCTTPSLLHPVHCLCPIIRLLSVTKRIRPNDLTCIL